MPLDRNWIGRKAVVVLDGPRKAGDGPADRPRPGLVLGAPAADGRPMEAFVLGLRRPRSIVRGVIVALAQRPGRAAGTIIVTAPGSEPPAPATLADRLALTEQTGGLLITELRPLTMRPGTSALVSGTGRTASRSGVRPAPGLP